MEKENLKSKNQTLSPNFLDKKSYRPSLQPVGKTIVDGESKVHLEYAKCYLETKDLWEKFHRLGTEMIITKTGR